MVLIFSPCIFKRRTKQILRIVNVIIYYYYVGMLYVICIVLSYYMRNRKKKPHTQTHFYASNMCMFRLRRVGVYLLCNFLFHSIPLVFVVSLSECYVSIIGFVRKWKKKNYIDDRTKSVAYHTLNDVRVHSRSRNLKHALNENGICLC